MNRNVALVYVRVSRLDREDRIKQQEGNGAKLRALSPTTQVEQCKVLPALNGLNVEVFEDLHRSGKDTKREGLDRLRARIQDPDVALVAVWSISRLARSVADLYALIEEFHQAGVGFVSAKESIDTTNAYGRAFLGFLAVLAQFERELTSERIAANWEQLARGGGLVGPLPCGYTRGEDGIVIDPDPAAVVRRLFEEYATGAHSIRTLAIWANEQGLRPPQHDRGHVGRRAEQLSYWTVDRVRDLLLNMRYAGRFIHKRRQNPDGEIVRGTFPAIIDWDLWTRCLEIRRGRQRDRGRGDHRVMHTLTGLLVCGSCGDNVRAKAARERRVYLCRTREAAGRCSEPRADAKVLEAEAHDWIRSITVQTSWRDVYAKARSTHGRRSAAQTAPERRQAIDAKIQRLRVSWESGARTDEAAFRREIAALRQELETIAVAAKPAPAAQHAATLESLGDRWDEMDSTQRRRLLGTIFESITMKDGALLEAKPKADWVAYLEKVTAHPEPRGPLEGLVGIEPTTPALGRRRSIR